MKTLPTESLTDTAHGFSPAPGLIYGICVACRVRTPLERLAPIPATSLCLDCAAKQAPPRPAEPSQPIGTPNTYAIRL